MTKNEIVGRLKDGGLDASSTNRSAAVYVADAIAGRAVPGWFAFRIVCDSEDTERRARAILSRWYDIDVGGNGVWRLKSKNRVPLMAIKRGGSPTPPEPPATEKDLYIEATFGSSSVYALVGIYDQLPDRFDIKYSTNGTTWKSLNIDYDAGQSEYIRLTQGSKVWFRGVNSMLGCFNPDAGIDRSFSFRFGGTNNRKFHIGGTVQSLVDGSGESLTAIPMSQLFNIYNYEFTVDEGLLPATTLVEGCYSGMFFNCSILKNTPSLPATVLAKDCYINMFGSCKALTQGPVLPAATLVENCYNTMFSSCNELAAVTCLAEDISATGCLQGWLSIVHETGTFTKKAGVSYPSGADGIPSGWTVVEV